jgi:D-3-phosphoglycerate dehydrogenase / 2-oxoglutarate reductase
MSKVLTAENVVVKDKTVARVLVADEISQEGITIMESKLEVVYDPTITPQKLIEVIGEFDALLVRSRSKVTKEVIEAGKRLKLVGRAGVGVDNIDLNAATQAGVLVVNSPEGNTASAAEHAVALMFALARQVSAADASMKSGKWERNKFLGTELFNKTLGVVGLGKVGSRVAQAGQGVGMKVIGFDPMISTEKAEQLNIQLVSLEEIWKRADFISLHTPKTRETANLINESVIAMMKPGVRIINAARGGIIDEAALAQAITDGKIAGAALDVFDSEPPAADSPLLKLGEKVVLTPHLGASTFEAQYNVAIDLAEQIRDYLAGGVVRSPVNLPSMRPEVMRALGKYIWLAEAMAAIAGELCDGGVKNVEVTVHGSLAQKDTAPLVTAALRGMFATKMESVTYVNAHLIAKSHGIQVRESRSEDQNSDYDELSITVSGERGKSQVSGTILAHNEPLITKINEFPINLSPQRWMLFTSHRDQPGMVARVAGILGKFDINISTMSVARKGPRDEAVMVMTLDDPIKMELVSELTKDPGIHMARFVTVDNVARLYE